MEIPEKIFYVCTGKKCKKKGGKEIHKHLKLLKKGACINDIKVIKTGCTGNCKLAPVLCVQPHNEWFFNMNTITAEDIFEEIIVRDKPLD